MSLYRIRYLKASWCGLDNYIKLFKDEIFQKAIGNTLEIVIIGTVLTMIVGIWIAVSIFDKRHG